MAVLKLKSTNPNLSYVLQKNPATQDANNEPFVKNVSGDKVYMWFEDPQSIIALYTVNAKNKDSNLDFTPYSDGHSYLVILDNILRSAYSKVEEHDTNEYETEVQISIYNHREIDLTIPFKNVVNQITKNRHTLVTIKDTSVKKALETVALISIQSCLHDPEYFIQDGQLVKYFNILVDHVEDYGMIRSFVSSIRSPKLFKSLQPILDKTKFKFQLNTGVRNRRSTLEELFKLSTANLIFDLGCGRGQYLRTLSKHYEQIEAVEIDENEFKGSTHTVRKAQLENVLVYNSDIFDFLSGSNHLTSNPNTDVLLTEVLEHMEKEASIEVLNRVLKLGVNQVFVTLPNKSFNQFYGLKDDEVRHDDHKWEPTFQDSIDFITQVLQSYPEYTAQYSSIGDSLKDDPLVHTTTLIVISKV